MIRVGKIKVETQDIPYDKDNRRKPIIFIKKDFYIVYVYIREGG